MPDGALEAWPEDDIEAWRKAPIDTLIQHLVEVHHPMLRLTLDRALALSVVVARGQELDPELGARLAAFAAVVHEHLQKEEDVVFPAIARGQGPMTRGPVAVMLKEHREHREALAEVHQLAQGATPAFDAPVGLALEDLQGALVELERRLWAHVRLEDEALFPRALLD